MARAHPVETSGQLSLEDSKEPRRVQGRPRTDETRVTTSRRHLTAQELLEIPDALLTRTHLRELGLERRAIDAVFRALPVVVLPGYSRPLIRVDHFRELVERFTYRDDRVRPIGSGIVRLNG